MRTIKPFVLLALCTVAVTSFNAQAQSFNTETRYLSGTGSSDAVMWDFYCTEGRRSGVWTRIRVPSNWETEGFGNYQYGGDRQRETNLFPKEQGKYRLNFRAPSSWRGRVVRLVFEGSMTDTEVWVNGHSAGPVHQGSFYRFKFDITSLVRLGQTNLLEVTVSKESSNTSVNRAERLGDYWNFGGIFRPVYLEALPPAFIDWTSIAARADGSFLLNVNLGGLQKGGQLVAQIVDDKGVAVGLPFTATVDPDQNVARLQTNISHPKLWTAETPNLYRVHLTLQQYSRPVHTVTERFGFRTFEVKQGDGLYLNGKRILLKGVNRHSFWPETGRALSKQISYDDVRLIKDMNMNAVRMSHYPPDAHFLDVCDELGLYVLDELAGWHNSYDTPTGRRLIGQMLRRDVNHPSILFWDNGNEGGWNRENDDEFARWDPQQREVLHPWEKFRKTNTDHYEKFDSHTRLANGPDIYMPTEFLHGLYDGGIGAGMWDYWELIRKSKVGGGGFFWALVDECVKRTDQNGRLDCAGNRGPDGIVGPHREHEGSFNTVKEIWSPVVVTAQEISPRDSRLVFAVENRYDFTNLRDCSFEWTLAKFPLASEFKSGHTVIRSGILRGPDVAPQSTGQFKLNLPPLRNIAEVIDLTAKDPSGHQLWTWSWQLNTKPKPAAPAGYYQVSTREDRDAISVVGGGVELVFSKQTGNLDTVKVQGRLLPFGRGPRFLAYRRNDRNYDRLGGENKLRQAEMTKEGTDILVEARYDGPLHYARWRVSADKPIGLTARLDYEYALEGVVDMAGVEFESDEKQFKGIRWLGMGPYRVWQNRLEGTRLDVWKNAYNDPVPGESWVVPEFKGYFREWHWATFDTSNGRLAITNLSQNPYLGVFKPKDGVNGLLNLPDIGIAFLDVIPAMRNKFHTTEEIGPQSKARQVPGTVQRTFEFHFGS